MKKSKRRLLTLLLAAILLSVTAVGCAVRAHPYGVSIRPVKVVRYDPPPPVRSCSTYRMCNIWGVCRSQTICAHY